MSTLTIKDLSMAEALDRKAMAAVRGGIILVLQPQYPASPIFPNQYPSGPVFPNQYPAGPV